MSEIGNDAFYTCTNLTSVTISRDVTIIGYRAFANCTSLASITIPTGVTTIGEQAFMDCKLLERAVFESDSPPAIIQNAFDGVVSEGIVYYPEGAEANYSDTWKEGITGLSNWILQSYDSAVPTIVAGEKNRANNAEAVVKFSSNDIGTWYYQLDGERPTAEELVGAEPETRGVMAVGENIVSLNALAAGEHTLYIAAEDEAGNVSNLLEVTLPAYVPPVDASISPVEAVFIRQSPADIAVTLAAGDYSLSAITCGEDILQAGTDYTESGDRYTIKKEYLATLDEGFQTVTFDMNAGIDPTLAVLVTDLPLDTYFAATNFGIFDGSGTRSATVEAESADFLRLEKDGIAVDPTHYSIDEGSTVITLSEAYMSGFANGEYLFRAVFRDGYAELSLTVAVPSSPIASPHSIPRTGDTAQAGAFLALLFFMLGLSHLWTVKRRRRKV